MHVLILGGGGLIGSRLARTLARDGGLKNGPISTLTLMDMAFSPEMLQDNRFTCVEADFCDQATIKSALEKINIKPHVCELTMIPTNTVKVTGSSVKQVLELVNNLEDHDDVQDVYANFDIPDEIMEEG